MCYNYINRIDNKKEKNMGKHYTANISITSTNKPEPAGPTTGYRGSGSERDKAALVSEDRSVTQIASIVVRASTMEKLVEKVIAHAELVEDAPDGR